MLTGIKRAFGRITPAQLAANELAEAELKLLEAQSGRDFADAMMGYHQQRVTRLRGFLASLQPAANDATNPDHAPALQRAA